MDDIKGAKNGKTSGRYSDLGFNGILIGSLHKYELGGHGSRGHKSGETKYRRPMPMESAVCRCFWFKL
jgi:hypothetical protein